MNDDVVAEILLRLPSDAVLRSRTVCKAWRRITTSPAFLAAHARLRPLEIIVQRHGVSGAQLDTIPLPTLDETRRRCLQVRYPEYTGPPEPCWRGYSLIGSCEGLLLFERGVGIDHFVCNPITRRWTMLPRPTGDFSQLLGFYLHGPSGEHRLLFHTDDQQGSHYICSPQVAGTRRLGQAIPVHGGFWTENPVVYLNHRGRLHWLRHPPVVFSTDDAQRPEAGDKILAFDTVSETFRRISPPPPRSGRYFGEQFFLLETDGKLSMTDILKGSMDLWVLEDYSNDRSWTRRLRVDLPPSLLRASWAMNSGMDGQNVILLGASSSCSVGLYDLTRKRLLKQIHFVTSGWPGDSVRRHRTPLRALVFRDSLERHTPLHARDSLEWHAFFDLRHPNKYAWSSGDQSLGAGHSGGDNVCLQKDPQKECPG